jgi:hypothetical protein
VATPSDGVAGKVVGDKDVSGTIDAIFGEFQRTPRTMMDALPGWSAARMRPVSCPFQLPGFPGFVTISHHGQPQQPVSGGPTSAFPGGCENISRRRNCLNIFGRRARESSTTRFVEGRNKVGCK